MSNNQYQKEATHAAILESALAVFSRKGFQDTTIKEIHENAGCNALTVFRHFQDKETLFYSVVEAYKDIKVDPADLQIAIDPQDLEGSLRRLSNLYFHLLFTNLDILRIFINESAFFPSIQKEAWFISPVLQRHFSRALAEAGLQKLPPHISELFIGYVTKLCLEFNTHDRIWDYTGKLLESFEGKMHRQIVFLCDVIQSLSA